ncbi:MAG: hypothetical protein RIT81_03815 [Deltaproteobacteria bacterium]
MKSVRLRRRRLDAVSQLFAPGNSVAISISTSALDLFFACSIRLWALSSFMNLESFATPVMCSSPFAIIENTSGTRRAARTTATRRHAWSSVSPSPSTQNRNSELKPRST